MSHHATARRLAAVPYAMALWCLLLISSTTTCSAFHPIAPFSSRSSVQSRSAVLRRMSTSASSTTDSTSSDSSTDSTTPNYNGVHVEKTGGMGAVTASQQALERNLSLGAPGVRPTGGHYLTKGGIQVTCHVDGLEFSSSREKKNTSAYKMEELVRLLDNHRGVLLTSSYEFPGRYARWSLGFVDPPVEISGRGTDLKITALNARGRLILPAIESAMEALKKEGILQSVESSTTEMREGTGDALDGTPTRIDVKVVPPPDVGTFSEEERSRQVRPCMHNDSVVIVVSNAAHLSRTIITTLSLAVVVFGGEGVGGLDGISGRRWSVGLVWRLWL